jgi:hypothetical protein
MIEPARIIEMEQLIIDNIPLLDEISLRYVLKVYNSSPDDPIGFIVNTLGSESQGEMLPMASFSQVLDGAISSGWVKTEYPEVVRLLLGSHIRREDDVVFLTHEAGLLADYA